MKKEKEKYAHGWTNKEMIMGRRAKKKEREKIMMMKDMEKEGEVLLVVVVVLFKDDLEGGQEGKAGKRTKRKGDWKGGDPSEEMEEERKKAKVQCGDKRQESAELSITRLVGCFTGGAINARTPRRKDPRML